MLLKSLLKEDFFPSPPLFMTSVPGVLTFPIQFL